MIQRMVKLIWHLLFMEAKYLLMRYAWVKEPCPIFALVKTLFCSLGDSVVGNSILWFFFLSFLICWVVGWSPNTFAITCLFSILKRVLYRFLV